MKISHDGLNNSTILKKDSVSSNVIETVRSEGEGEEGEGRGEGEGGGGGGEEEEEEEERRREEEKKRRGRGRGRGRRKKKGKSLNNLWDNIFYKCPKLRKTTSRHIMARMLKPKIKQSKGKRHIPSEQK